LKNLGQKLLIFWVAMPLVFVGLFSPICAFAETAENPRQARGLLDLSP